MIEGLDVWDRCGAHARPVAHRRDPDRRRARRCSAGRRSTALIIQNTNPLSVAPDQNKVKQGFAREDLFVCVHEQFMTETAKMADVVLPATTFLEHDDIYRGGGHQYIILGPKLVEPPGECRNNHEVICGAGQARSAPSIRGFAMSPRELIDQMLQRVQARHACRARSQPLDRLPAAVPAIALSRRLSPGRTASSASSRTGRTCRSAAPTRAGRSPRCRRCRITGPSIEQADAEHPFRLATSPARGFLNSTFNETPTSLAQEKRPTVMIHPDDASAARHRRRR